MTDKIMVITSCGSRAEAEGIARHLVTERLAACVSVTGEVQSVYRWQGEVEQASEVLLLVKSTADRFPALRDAISSLHSYEVPEILALPVLAGSPGYLAWMEGALAGE